MMRKPFFFQIVFCFLLYSSSFAEVSEFFYSENDPRKENIQDVEGSFLFQNKTFLSKIVFFSENQGFRRVFLTLESLSDKENKYKKTFEFPVVGNVIGAFDIDSAKEYIVFIRTDRGAWSNQLGDFLKGETLYSFSIQKKRLVFENSQRAEGLLRSYQ